jgi:hypothetical protein
VDSRWLLPLLLAGSIILRAGCALFSWRLLLAFRLWFWGCFDFDADSDYFIAVILRLW